MFYVPVVEFGIDASPSTTTLIRIYLLRMRMNKYTSMRKAWMSTHKFQIIPRTFQDVENLDWDTSIMTTSLASNEFAFCQSIRATERPSLWIECRRDAWPFACIVQADSYQPQQSRYQARSSTTGKRIAIVKNARDEFLDGNAKRVRRFEHGFV